MRLSIRSCFSALIFVVTLTLTTAFAVAQGPGNQPAQPSLSGRYEGVVRDGTGEQKVTLDVVDEAGKFSGTITTSHGVFKVVKGQLVDGTLTLEFETNAQPHSLSIRQKENVWTGTIQDAGKTPTIELRRVLPDLISGEWDAVADAQGQPFPFTLTMKLDGEKVTGSSNSELGNSPISSGNWKDGKLSVLLEGGAGQIALVATMIDGKLSGDYDFAGQLSGKWVAIRRK